MVITAVAVGTRGDVNPLAELGEEMIKRGHEFRILTSEGFRPLIESKGVTFLKLDTDADHVMQYLVAEYKTSIDFIKGMFRLKKENPGYIIAISPGTCCADDEEWQRMLELDKKDVAISAQYMRTAEEIMRHGDENVPDYMIFLQKGDFTGALMSHLSMARMRHFMLLHHRLKRQ